MNNYKKNRRTDDTFYPKTTNLRVVALNPPSNNEQSIEQYNPIEEYQAGEDLTGWKDQGIMIDTDGLAYKAQAILSNWNRVRGILVTEGNTGETVRVRIAGIHTSDSYDWSTSDRGAPIYIRNSGLSISGLSGVSGGEVLYIHSMDVFSDNSVRILNSAHYFLFF